MRYFLPDYDNCCVNIINSIMKHYHLPISHKTLPLVDKALNHNYKNVVVLLLDGLGQSVLMKNLSETSFLRRHFAQELSAVYPSSTVPATVSFKTGLTPLEHGWWSHFLYFKELGSCINVYTNNDAFSRKNCNYPEVAQTVLPYATFLDKIAEKNTNVKSYNVTIAEARDNCDTTQVICNNFDEITQSISTLCSLEENHLIYAYYNYPDDCMHKNGIESSETKDLLIELDSQIEQMCLGVKDTLFIISADHGQHSLNEVRDLRNYPDVLDCLVMYPNGCTRCTNYFVKQNKAKDFERLAKKYFGDKFLLFSKEELLNKKLLGNGIPHPRLEDLLGDYVLIAIDDCNICCTTIYDNPINNPLGIHGGMTMEEMRVPLIIFGNKEK